MENRKSWLFPLLAILLIMSLIVGATFALFTSKKKINIAVNAAEVDVTASIDSSTLKTYSMGVLQNYGEFELGGTADFTNEGDLVLDLIAPGDKATFTIDVVNESTILVYYKITVDITPANEAGEALAAALVKTANGKTIGSAEANVGWTTLSVGSDPEKVDIVIELPYDAGDECQGGMVNIAFVVEARQGNAPIDRSATIETLDSVLSEARSGDMIVLEAGENTSEAPLTAPIVIDKDITLVPNGMYLVSEAASTFTVTEGAKLTVSEGSFTIKNTSANGAAVLVDGGEFVMEGGSFDAHTAVRTTEGKSSTVTMTAGYSNKVTVAFDSKGNDTINVTGGSIYSSAEAIKTTADTDVTINISGGLLSSRTTQYSAAVNLKCPATVNMTGGRIENTYSSGYDGSSAIEANVPGTTINLSGSAALSSNGVAVMLGSHWSEPAVLAGRIVLNMSGDATISATSVMGFGIRYAQDCCDVNISGNAKVNATFQAIQFNTNNYVYTNSTLTVSENATITSTAGRIGGGYAIASNGNVLITGGTIYGSTAGIASTQAGAVVVIDNSTSGTPININSVDIAAEVTYTVAGDPTIG